ncbi:MAG: hypothetical protein WCI74_06465, partial [Actinomycetes bacterium]
MSGTKRWVASVVGGGLVAGGLAVGGVIAEAGPASAAVQVLGYNGGVAQTYTVPAGVSVLRMEVLGGGGSSGT